MFPVLMALIAATGFAMNAIFVRLAGRRVPVVTGTATSVVSSLSLAVIPALLLDLPFLAEIPIVGFLWIVLLAFITYPLGQTFNYASIRRIGAARGAPLFSSSPLWATILAVAFLGERPNVLVVAGTLTIFVGIIFIINEGRSGGPAVK